MLRHAGGQVRTYPCTFQVLQAGTHQSRTGNQRPQSRQATVDHKGHDLFPRPVHLAEEYSMMLISGISREDLTLFVATSHTIIANHARHESDTP